MKFSQKKTVATYWRNYEYLNNKDRLLRFSCECGKNYVSFPSLYLHCKKKHKMKISTKPTQEECQIIRNDGQTVMKYWIVKNSQSFAERQRICQENQNQTTKIQEIVKKFIAWGNNIENRGKLFLDNANNKIIFANVMKKFTGYILENTNALISENDLNILPYYLNGFALKFMSEQNDGDLFSKACTYLLFFSRWLLQEGYTQLQVILEGQQDKKLPKSQEQEQIISIKKEQ